jgi:hypothetical protein
MVRTKLVAHLDLTALSFKCHVDEHAHADVFICLWEIHRPGPKTWGPESVIRVALKSGLRLFHCVRRFTDVFHDLRVAHEEKIIREMVQVKRDESETSGG